MKHHRLAAATLTAALGGCAGRSPPAGFTA